MRPQGFTLIEMSIVLVIIGLIVGGILMGQDLVSAAYVRAAISQIERLNQATNTFRGKYGALPGDISATLVTQLGFTVVPARAGTAGQGDGNGIIEGYEFSSSKVTDGLTNGEGAWFWEDLTSNTHLVEGAFTLATSTGLPPVANNPAKLLPAAKIGNGTYVYVYANNSVNYFGLSTVGAIDPNGALDGSVTNNVGTPGSSPGLTVRQAYAIDAKMDDGFPQAGNVIAQYQNWPLTGPTVFGPVWAAGGGVTGTADTSVTNGTSTTCYDNNGLGGVQHYSVTQSGGTNVNCALSFRFQ